MQKNNCKLKTIFKKGLSFSIALALGAAATSLNLAKTAEATLSGTPSKAVYLAGEKVDATGISGGTVTHVKLTKNGTKGAAIAIGDATVTVDTTAIDFGESESSFGVEDQAVTVYDWAKIYDTSKTLKVSHNGGTVKAEVLDVLSFRDLKSGKETEHAAALRTLLESGAITIDGTSIAKDAKFDYTKHNGKAISVKVGDVVCNLGTLEVTRTVTKVELAADPTEFVYVSGEHINFEGLALKATYDDGQTGEINWTEDSKKSFTAVDKDGNSVDEGAPITKTIKDIRVSYKDSVSGKTLEVPDDDVNKFSLFFCKTQNLGDKASVSVQGTFTEGATVNSIILDENNDAYKKLIAAFDKNAQVIAAYDIILNCEGYVGASRVSFNVGKNYAGQVVTVKHLAGDKIETFVTTVDADGIVTINTSSFSPFMIVLGATEEDKAAAAETEQKNAEEAAKSEAAKSEAAKASSTAAASNATSKSASKSAKTGDASVVAFSVFGFVALISAAVLAFMKKNRKNFEK